MPHGYAVNRALDIGLVREGVPRELAVDVLHVDGTELVVVSHALGPTADHDGLEVLPTAMREVARLALEGLDNAAIATARGTSVRTVAKQLEGIYRRLGIGSRRELMARHADRGRGGA